MGNSNKSGDENGVACPVPRPPDLSGVTRVTLDPRPPLRNHAEAVALANAEADTRLAHPMLLSWYDRDRDFADGIEARAARRVGSPARFARSSWHMSRRDCGFEAPQHVSECHQDSAVPGYVDYALSRGATLRVDSRDGGGRAASGTAAEDVENGRFVFFYRDAAV